MSALTSAPLAVSGLWLACVAWLIVRAFGQRHALQPLVRAAVASVQTAMPGAAAEAAPRVAIVVPARDESANIGPCLDSLLAQRYPADRWRIIVVDDGSTDDTAAVVTARACARLTLVTAPPLPPGWKGKVHACSIGALAAGQRQRPLRRHLQRGRQQRHPGPRGVAHLRAGLDVQGDHRGRGAAGRPGGAEHDV
ncbi:MAG: glycosyltransferase [Steroidobacteraceae bacterium]